MTMTNVRPVVDAPTRTPYRYGLFSVLDFLSGREASAGARWNSYGCNPIQYAQDPCLVDGATPHTKLGLEHCGQEYGPDPFTVIAYDTSSLGHDRSTTAGAERAMNVLALHEQHMVEDVVSIEMAAAATVLAVPAGPTGFTEMFLAALGAVEGALATLGGEGVILVSREAAPFLGNYVSATGSVLRTKIGTPVAALSGFGLPADPYVVLGVNAFKAWRSPIETGYGFDTDLNDHADYAERDYAVGWECDAVRADPTPA